MKTEIIVHARNEYCNQLVNLLVPYINTGIHHMYKKAKEFTEKEPNKVLCVFELILKEIPGWERKMIERETTRIVSENHILPELLQVTLISHIRVLLYPIKNVDKSMISNVTLDAFIHQCYIETSTLLLDNLFLYYDNVNFLNRQANIRECNKLIADGIKNAIQKVLPMKHILETYLTKENTESSETKNDIEQPEQQPEQPVLPVQQPVQQPVLPVQQPEQPVQLPVQPVAQPELLDEQTGGDEEDKKNEINRYVSSILSHKDEQSADSSASQYGGQTNISPKEKVAQKEKIIESYGKATN